MPFLLLAAAYLAFQQFAGKRLMVPQDLGVSTPTPAASPAPVQFVPPVYYNATPSAFAYNPLPTPVVASPGSSYAATGILPGSTPGPVYAQQVNIPGTTPAQAAIQNAQINAIQANDYSAAGAAWTPQQAAQFQQCTDIEGVAIPGCVAH